MERVEYGSQLDYHLFVFDQRSTPPGELAPVVFNDALEFGKLGNRYEKRIDPGFRRFGTSRDCNTANLKKIDENACYCDRVDCGAQTNDQREYSTPKNSPRSFANPDAARG